MTSIGPEALTWSGLLAQWMHFAQAAMVIPETAQGRQWRESVASLINLQAVTFALADLDQLAVDERALALDKAEMLIDDATARLWEAWRSEAQPESVLEITRDARLALAAARSDKRQIEGE